MAAERRIRPALILLTALCLATPVFAEEDIAGGRDLPGVPRFAGSWIVAYQPAQEVGAYEWPLGPATKNGAFVRAKESLRLGGRITKVTYRIPDGVSGREAFAHFQDVIPVEQESRTFVCEARDCGRSQYWAIGIFGEPTLYGPDENQFYLAGAYRHQGDAYLVSVYVIQRGNRRVYAHLELLQVDEVPELETAAGLEQELNSNGYVVVQGQGVRIDTDGGVKLEPALVEALRKELESFANRRVFVVCHLYGPGDPQALIDASTRCASNFVAALGQFRGPEFEPFGAGPLFPRHAMENESRVELVIP